MDKICYVSICLNRVEWVFCEPTCIQSITMAVFHYDVKGMKSDSYTDNIRYTAKGLGKLHSR